MNRRWGVVTTEKLAGGNLIGPPARFLGERGVNFREKTIAPRAGCASGRRTLTQKQIPEPNRGRSVANRAPDLLDRRSQAASRRGDTQSLQGRRQSGMQEKTARVRWRRSMPRL